MGAIAPAPTGRRPHSRGQSLNARGQREVRIFAVPGTGTLIVNGPAAVLPPTSAIVTGAPDVPLGTLNVQLNAPVTPVISEPFVQLEIALESMTDGAVDGKEPVPGTVPAAPTGPCLGLPDHYPERHRAGARALRARSAVRRGGDRETVGRRGRQASSRVRCCDPDDVRVE